MGRALCASCHADARDSLTDLELFLARRAQGLPLESPAVRR